MAAGKNKKDGGVFRGVLLLALGFTAGMGVAAAVAVYINELHLPFITPPTRLPAVKTETESGREVVEFHELLRQQKPSRLRTEDNATTNSPRQFVFYLQVGVFKDNGNAENVRGQMALVGRRALIRTGQAADGDTLYRVWLGPYEDEEQAENIRAQLALEGYSNISLLKTAE